MSTQHDTILRSLDIATPDLNVVQRERGEALLEQILATPVETPTRRQGARRTTYRRLAFTGAAAAALLAGSVVVQGFGGSQAAFASWTPTATRVSPHDLNVVTHACRDKIRELATNVPGQEQVQAATMAVALSERRGDFVAMLFSQANPETSAACVARSASGSSDVAEVNATLGGSSGPAPRPRPGRITGGTISQFAMGSGSASFADGFVGPGVVWVTVHAGAFRTDATVAGGRFAAWWPGKAFTNDRPPSGQGGPKEVITFDVRLANGQTLTNVAPDTGE